MKTRAELMKSKGYWLAKIQTELFREIEDFKREKGMNNTQLAEYLGCSKGYVSQLLNGDFDHKMSKFIELSLAMGKVPQIEYKDLEEYIELDACNSTFQIPVLSIIKGSDYSSYQENIHPNCYTLECA